MSIKIPILAMINLIRIPEKLHFYLWLPLWWWIYRLMITKTQFDRIMDKFLNNSSFSFNSTMLWTLRLLISEQLRVIIAIASKYKTKQHQICIKNDLFSYHILEENFWIYIMQKVKKLINRNQSMKSYGSNDTNNIKKYPMKS